MIAFREMISDTGPIIVIIIIVRGVLSLKFYSFPRMRGGGGHTSILNFSQPFLHAFPVSWRPSTSVRPNNKRIIYHNVP